MKNNITSDNIAALLNHVYAVVAISISLVIGKLLSYFIGGLTGSLYGMLVFAILLALGLFEHKRIEPTIALVIGAMGVCFVPAGVGTMDQLALLQSHGFTMIFMIVVNTVAVIVVVGVLANKLLNSRRSKKGT